MPTKPTKDAYSLGWAKQIEKLGHKHPTLDEELEQLLASEEETSGGVQAEG